MDKKAVAIGLGAAAIGGVILVTIFRKAKAVPEEGITIEVYDQFGNKIPRTGSFNLNEGQSYTLKANITNTSTKGGQPWEATLGIGVTIKANSSNLISPSSKSEYFGAGATKSFSYSFSVPLGYGGLTGAIGVAVSGPDGAIIASASELIYLIEVSVEYGASIVIS